MHDDRLYEMIQAGSQRALDDLFTKYFAKLCFYSIRFTGSKELSEEIVSDVFLRIWDNREKTKLGNIKSYLYASTKNGSLNSIRKESKFQSLDQVDPIARLQTMDPEQETMAKETLEEIIKIIDFMPAKTRTVFLLNRVNGLKYKEISETLGISPHTVQNHMIKAVRLLNEKIKGRLFP